MAGGINLGNPTGFASATSSGLSSIVQQINGRDPSKWDIEEGSYNGVKFHIFLTSDAADTGVAAAVPNITDKGGNRLVPFRFPYVDGVTFDSLGIDGETFDFDIVIFGNNYRSVLSRLFKELRSPKPGKLVHPVRGIITCRMHNYEMIHSNEKRKAVALKINFVEQSFSIGDLKADTGKNIKSALNSALKAFAKIDAIITKINGAKIFFDTLKASIVADLDSFKNLFAQSLRNINQTFNSGSSVDLPLLLPTNLGGLQTANGNFSSNVFTPSQSPSDPFASVPIETTPPTTLTTKQAIDNVNSVRAQLNAIIVQIASGGNGQGSLEFYPDILDLKNIAILLQKALEAGIASSNAQVISYTLPRLMSIREVAFSVGIPLDRVLEIELLNAALLSVNYIEKGSVLQVPSS